MAQKTAAEKIREFVKKHPHCTLVELNKGLKGDFYSSQLSDARRKLGISSLRKKPVRAGMPSSNGKAKGQASDGRRLIMDLFRLTDKYGVDRIQKALTAVEQLDI